MQIERNAQFEEAYDLLEHTRTHVFLTGKAGTGKSTLLTYFRAQSTKNVVVLAPTGVAAVHIEGETIHSFFHFRPNVTPENAQRTAAKHKNKKIYQAVETIILDEVSMVRADLLDSIDIFLRTVRSSDEPFGGVQMIFIGDMYQLPPVTTSADRRALLEIYPSPYFFDARVMHQLRSPLFGEGFVYIELETVYRQKDDAFIQLLNAIRNRSISPQQMETLNSRIISSRQKPTDRHMYLTVTNAQAHGINTKRLQRLGTKEFLYEGEIEGDFDTKSLPTDIELVLKKGARVMFVNNDLSGRWINGTLGTVVGLTTEEVHVEIDGGEIVKVEMTIWHMYEATYNAKTKRIDHTITGSFSQIPLRLAWAITIHKSQGKTFESVVIDIGRGTFAHGQMYVALSRCRSFEGILLAQEVRKNHILVDFTIVQFITRLQYVLSERSLSLEEKIQRIERAIQDGMEITITYLKARDEKSRRMILPESVGEMSYAGKTYIGLAAYCKTRKASRVFRVDRILEIHD